jgi:hypothetical protein
MSEGVPFDLAGKLLGLGGAMLAVSGVILLFT